jgi:flavin-binding protein dodecin
VLGGGAGGCVLPSPNEASGEAPMIPGRDNLSLRQENSMTVARITEISSISANSFEDAIRQGVARANQTLKNVKGAWVKDQEVTIDNGKVTGYKVILKVTFVLE